MQKCEVKREGDTLIASMSSEIDHHAAKGIRNAIDSELRVGGLKKIILDFSAVTFMDSSGIGLIIGRAAKADEVGASVLVTGLNGTLGRIVRMSGVERLQNVNIN